MTQLRKTGLGKGLSALLDDSEVAQPLRNQAREPASSGSIGLVNIADVKVNPYQPRADFDKESLRELADSIKIQGLIQPITVRKMDREGYQLISGERRLRASKLAGLTQIPAYMRTANDQQMLEMALIENIQRENLNAIEVALSFQRMIDECNLKQEELGDRVSKNRSTVTNYLRLLRLPPMIQASLRDEKLSMGHAKALLGLDEVEKQLFVHDEILNKGLSVRNTEELVRSLHKKSLVAPGPAKEVSYEYKKIQDDLASKFATKVKLKVGGNGKGAIEIPFLSEDDLGRILELLDW